MATSNSSCSPSSSAVTIPIPGKSILKRPPPPPTSLLSRITRFLPTPTPSQPSSTDETRPLKRAHFILPRIATVYPISSLSPPSTPNLKEEKKAIESREAERRRRVVRANSVGGESDGDDWWPLDKVESFYKECCAGCDEKPDPAITFAFKHASSSSPRSADFSGVQLNVVSASILSDVFTIEWGLRKLVFRECDLDDQTLKPILHALLIPDSLSFLSVASNRRLKTPAFRLIGAYVAKSRSIQFLDLSQNNLDKKSVEHIVAALTAAPDLGLVSLRLDDCALRPASLETLARAVRTSSLRNISMRHNRINATGAVALALMIRDYPDVVPSSLSSPSSSFSGTPSSSTTSSPTSSVLSLPLSPPAPALTLPTLPAIINIPPQSAPARAGPILPPPRHPSTQPLQTTYTPYVPRARRGPPTTPTPAHALPASRPLHEIPLITSSLQGGVTTRHPIVPQSAAPVMTHFEHGSRGGQGQQQHQQRPHDTGPSAALLDKVRALDALPRLGALRTLDLKGNDLRTGITYIAQVLKRNRTLKVLNLSENKLDVAGLVAIAEALKYNSCLETLDLSKNPCSGPGLDGIQSLRTAFTLNTALKRLFLSSTSLTSSGAIALAEFLPESASLLHLDLTMNNIDIAGVMALSSGLKANHVMRCLDLNIPPGDEKFARMCRDILNSCVRNTEEAERGGGASASGRGVGKGVWGMIEESELAKTIRLGEETTPVTSVIARAQTCIVQLTELVSSYDVTPPASTTTLPLKRTPPLPLPSPTLASLEEAKKTARKLADELGVTIQRTEDPGQIEELLELHDQIMALLSELATTTTPRAVTGGRKLHGLGISLVRVGSDVGVGVKANGHVNGRAVVGEEEEEEEPTTPRVDKGKGRAEPEPEEHERVVLSPTLILETTAASLSLGESEDEDEDEDEEGAVLRYVPTGGVEDAESAMDRSRSWVEEEGEVFRKGTVLLGPEEMEGEYAGEELRKELLEAMVDRPPPRALTDEFGLEIVPDQEHPASSSPSLASPITGATDNSKPPPRPYVPRRGSASSSSSSNSLMSPTVPHSAPAAVGSGEFLLNRPTSPVLSKGAGAGAGAGAGIMPSLSRIRTSGEMQ